MRTCSASGTCERFVLEQGSDLFVELSRFSRLPWMRSIGEVDRALLGTMFSELASNILKYARRGQVLAWRVERGAQADVHLVAEDHGPGIADLDAAMADHFSTGGSLGLGLPGVRRMADGFDIRSLPGQGTRVSTRKRVSLAPSEASSAAAAAQALTLPLSAASAVARARCDIAGQVRSCVGEQLSGDGVLWVPVGAGWLLAVVDASGHGPRAHAVTQRLLELLRELARTAPNDGTAPPLDAWMRALDRAARGSVGAAVGLLHVDATQGACRYLGVGNTRIVKLGERPWRGVSRDGVVGERLPGLYEQRVALHAGDYVLLSSDGVPEVGSHVLGGALRTRSAAEMAASVLAQFARDYDDSACLVLKWLG